VVDISRYGSGENPVASIAAAAIAASATGNQVGSPIAAAIAVGLQVVQRKLGSAFDGRAAISACHTIPEVDSQAFNRTNPVHALVLDFAACAVGYHVPIVTCRCFNVNRQASQTCGKVPLDIFFRAVKLLQPLARYNRKLYTTIRKQRARTSLSGEDTGPALITPRLAAP